MEKTYSPNKLVSQLLKTPHGNLSEYIEPSEEAINFDSFMYGKLLAWNHHNGVIRDSKVAFPIIHLRNTKDVLLVENSLAALMRLGPRELVRALAFEKFLHDDGYGVVSNYSNIIAYTRHYLRIRENAPLWFDRVAIRSKNALKRLYIVTKTKPNARANSILFKKDYSPDSIFAIARDMKSMSPKEISNAIINNKIPLTVAIGSIPKLDDPAIVFALIETMTPNELIQNSSMLLKLNAMKDPVLKASYSAAIEKAQESKNVTTLKAGRAIENISDESMKKKLESVQESQLDKTSIEGDWLVLADRSGSMESAIEIGKFIAATLTRSIKGKVHLIFFDHNIDYFNVSGKSLEEIKSATSHIDSRGATDTGQALSYLIQKDLQVDGIAIVSDGGENPATFVNHYRKYIAYFDHEPTINYFWISGHQWYESNNLARNMTGAGIDFNQFNLNVNKIDYYSLPNLISTMRANRFALYDEIMQTNYLTLEAKHGKQIPYPRIRS
jgi:hypothetical protein